MRLIDCTDIKMSAHASTSKTETYLVTDNHELNKFVAKLSDAKGFLRLA